MVAHGVAESSAEPLCLEAPPDGPAAFHILQTLPQLRQHPLPSQHSLLLVVSGGTPQVGSCFSLYFASEDVLIC